VFVTLPTPAARRGRRRRGAARHVRRAARLEHVQPGRRADPALRATDTGDSWFLTLFRFTGTDPHDGISYDGPDARPADRDPGTRAAAEVAGTAADLDCWLWHRPPAGPVERSGDRGVLGRYQAAIAPGIN
jgi:hypothetical protein